MTKDEIPDPQNLKVESIIDGEARQSANTNLMIHPIAELVEWLSKGMTLNPGDVIATGTPSGVGMAFTPQRLLKRGSMVEIVIEGVGRLKNVAFTDSDEAQALIANFLITNIGPFSKITS